MRWELLNLKDDKNAFYKRNIQVSAWYLLNIHMPLESCEIKIQQNNM